ncbi:MAG: hypothetical protein OXI87_15350 [Albidovulum sp.]|nr:hypothetical protein [Albidovulum sp.]
MLQRGMKRAGFFRRRYRNEGDAEKIALASDPFRAGSPFPGAFSGSGEREADRNGTNAPLLNG